MEEGVFPHDRSLADPDSLEEERRLCYVGITRARRRLYLTHTWGRTLFGQTRDSLESRFMKEIPEHLVADLGPGPAGVWARFRAERERFDGPPSFGRAGSMTRRPATPVKSTGAEDLGLAAGDRIVHARWGEGVVVSSNGEGSHAEAVIAFDRHGEKRFLLSATPLKRA